MHGKHRVVAHVLPDGAPLDNTLKLNAEALSNLWDIDQTSIHSGIANEMYRAPDEWVMVNKTAVRELLLDNGLRPGDFRTLLEGVRTLGFRAYAEKVAADLGIPFDEVYEGAA